MSGGGKGKAKSKAHVDAKLKDLNKKERQHLRDSEFLCAISFKNTMPPVPSGPYFKKVDLSRSVDKFSEYCMNSLKKAISGNLISINSWALISIWSIRTQSFKRKRKVDFGDLEKKTEQEVRLYLSGVGGSGAGRRDARKEHEANHWWLRDTLYFNNELGQTRARESLQQRRLKRWIFPIRATKEPLLLPLMTLLNMTRG